MHKGRLEAFSDGMIAVIITIMVLEMKAPDGPDFSALAPLFPVFVTYVLSYIYIGIYWNNHHHLLHISERIDGRVMWANLFLLFWLSLFPFAIRWMDETGLAALPTAAYGFVLVMAALSYTALVRTLIACNGRHSALARAIGKDLKGKLSIAFYLIAMPLAFVQPWVAMALYIAVALIWLVPDRRIESII
jgi:uncharacterized membrane protein